MALEIIKNIDVDFYNKEYILINAKQYDTNSRVIAITCYNQGELMRLSDSQHSAYVRYRKADGHPVLNSCRINNRSQVLVELTEQMLAANGICNVDLIVINKGDALVNTDTGEILAIDDSSILSTMAFYVNAYEVAVSNSEFESSYEFDGLNDLMQRAEADYREVMLTSKSWAVGKTGIRDGEDTDNAKYYSKQASNSANASDTSASNAAISERNAEEHMSNALEYMNTAKSHMDEAQASEDNARTSETNALNSEVTTKSYMEATDGYMKSTEEYMNTTDGYMATTQGYMNTTEGYMNTTDGYMNKTEEYMNATDGYMDKAEEFMNTTDGYMNTTHGYMETSQGYMDTAKSHMDNAEAYMNNAEASMNNAKTSETSAANSETNANSYMEATDSYMKTTEGYMTTTQGYMGTTEDYMNDTKSHMDNAAASEENAALSESNASNSAILAQSYTVGGTGTRDGEDNDNAQYYCEVVKSVVNGLNSGFIPMGTISFGELATAEKATGFTYNIRDDFVTDSTFAEGEGKSYTAGTNVYCRLDGLWDCFGGAASPTATVDEVVEYLGLLM